MPNTQEADVKRRRRFFNVLGGEFNPAIIEVSSNALLEQVATNMDEGSQPVFAANVTITVTDTGADLFTVGTAEPRVPGTDIPIYRISALLDGGMRVAEVMEDFPSLTADQILLARDHARKHPNYGSLIHKRASSGYYVTAASPNSNNRCGRAGSVLSGAIVYVLDSDVLTIISGSRRNAHRAGPGCLNRISASISGAPAGVRLPSGGAAE